MTEMQGATEYHDTWCGLRILVPQGWRVRRSRQGLVLHDRGGERAIVVQPRPGAGSVDSLEQELLAWLRRLDAQAELRAEPEGPAAMRVCTASACLGPGREFSGVFDLQLRPAGGLICGYLAPVTSYDPDSRTAVEALATLRPAPAVSRYLWRDPMEDASTALVPSGWRAEGRINRDNPGGVGTPSFQAWADEWMGTMASAEARLFMEPGPLSAALNRLAGGRIELGKLVDAAGYAEMHLLPALRQEAPDATIQAVIPRADIIPMAAARQAASSGLSLKRIFQGQPSGADVMLSFHIAGQEMRQVSRVMTMRVPSSIGRGVSVWMATVPHAYRAPVDRFAEWEPVLDGASASFEVNPKWRQGEQARVSRQLKRNLPTVEQPPDPEPLLQEAERLTCELTGQPLGLHERPFHPPHGRHADGGDPAELAPGLYEEPIWQGKEAGP